MTAGPEHTRNDLTSGRWDGRPRRRAIVLPTASARIPNLGDHARTPTLKEVT